MHMRLKTKKVLCCILIGAGVTANTLNAQGQAVGDYRTVASGSWSNTAIWQVYDGSSWISAVSTPNSGNGQIIIAGGDSVNIASGITIDETSVSSGAILRLAPGITLTVNNGSGDDLVVDGVFHMSGNLSYSGAGNESTVINHIMNYHSDGVMCEITARSITISPGGTLNISGSGNKSFRYSGGIINNYGTTNWTGSGNIRGGSNMFFNAPGGEFLISNDQEIQYDGGGGGYITFNNAGLVRKTIATGTTGMTGANFSNSGQVIIESGTFRLNGNGTHSGDFLVDTLCQILITAGTHSCLDSCLFTGAGEIRMTGGSINFDGNGMGSIFDTGSTFRFINGSLGGNGKVYIHGSMYWQPESGSAEITTMNTTISTAGTLHIAGAANKSFRYSGGAINNYGAVNWSGTGNIRGASNTFNNHPGAILTILNNQEIQYDGGGGTNLVFNNYGTIIKTSGGGITRFASSSLNNHAYVYIDGGTLMLNFNSSHTGTFSIDSGCLLNFSGGTHNIGNGALFTGHGSMQTSGGTTEFNGTASGAVADTFLTYDYTGGNVGGSGIFHLYGTMNWSAPANNSTILGINNFNLYQTANLNVLGTFSRHFRGTMNNSGHVLWSGTGDIVGGNGTFNNNSDGILELAVDAGIYYDGGGGSRYLFNNDGLVVKSAGSGNSVLDYITMTNNGTIRVEAGTINISGLLSNFSSNTLTGGRYYIIGTLRFNNADIRTNQAHICLDGPLSQVLNNTGGADALLNFTTNGDSGFFLLRNGRNFTTQAGTFTNNGILDCDSSIFSGPGNFSHSAAATLIIGSSDGIMMSASGGNIQSSGTRTYSSAGNYTFRGYVQQSSGDGLPQQAHTLTLDNQAGLILDTGIRISDSLVMKRGNVWLNTDTLTLGFSTGNTGILDRDTGTVIGAFERWFDAEVTSATLFPVGTSADYRPAEISYTTAPASGGSLTARFNSADPGTDGLFLIEGDTLSDIFADGWWTLDAGNNLSGGVYSLYLTAGGFQMIESLSELHMVKRQDPLSAWTLDGMHLMADGTLSVPVVRREGLSGFSDFGIALPRPITRIAVCGSYVAPDGSTYTNSQIIRIHYPDSVFIDSVQIIDLKVTTIDTSLTVSVPQVISNQAGATYQWLDCNNAFSAISGEIQSTITAAANGSFAVEISMSNCVDTSGCVNMTTVGLHENGNDLFSVYPNPGNDLLYIVSRDVYSRMQVSIHDVGGKELFRKDYCDQRVIQLEPELRPGIYIMSISTDQPSERRQIRLLRY